MPCPFCGDIDTKVVDSRSSLDKIRRRRECLRCGRRFTTYETVESAPIMIRKKNGALEEFSEEKLSRGVLHAFRKRPMARELIDELCANVKGDLMSRDILTIDSKELGEIVLSKLLALDEVAYIRFASVYKDFSDAQSFVSEIKKIKNLKEHA
jgi:transcriptional repressor NrdR